MHAAYRHRERHSMARIGALRAAILGANDGIVSTASLLIGVASAGAAAGQIVTAGVAGVVAGAMAMAAGEYVSVSSQADAERADLERERIELADDHAAEHMELAAIYRQRGLDVATAATVADQLMAHDALAAHARDELGIFDQSAARPVQAALASAASFFAGAVIPLLAAMLATPRLTVPLTALAALLALGLLGTVGARAGGAAPARAAIRVTFWGAAAMAATALIGHLVGQNL